MKQSEFGMRACVVLTILAFAWVIQRENRAAASLDRMERQVKPLAALQSKLPITITVYVSPELGRPRRISTTIPGLPGWAEPKARTGEPQPPR